MPFFDLPLEQLIAYRSSVQVPDDLERFWADTLSNARGLGSKPTLTPIATGLELVETWDVTFTGFNGDAVRGWLHRPARCPEALPIIVHYQGYGADVDWRIRCRCGCWLVTLASKWIRVAKDLATRPGTRRTRPAQGRRIPAS